MSKRRIFKSIDAEIDHYYICNPKTKVLLFFGQCAVNKYKCFKSHHTFDTFLSGNLPGQYQELRLTHTKMWKLLNYGSSFDIGSLNFARLFEGVEAHNGCKDFIITVD